MRTSRTKLQLVGLVVILALTSSAFVCTSSTKNLALASDAISHALANAQQASKQAVTSGAISAQDDQAFEAELSRTAQAGLDLDTAIRAGATASTVSQKVNVFLDAFNTLQTQGVLGIKNPSLQLTIATIINGAETSVAIISATVGGSK